MRKIAVIILVLMMACSLLNISFAEESSEKLKLEQNGSYVLFGSYEQDNNLDNGPEPIEWIVLDVQDGKVLLLSQYGLDARAFDDNNTIAWADCSLRAWLNNEFIHTAFNLQDRMAILKTETEDGVQDDVFLLSYEDTDYYFSCDEGRMCVPTDYAIEKGAYDYSGKDQIGGRSTGVWWLRSPGYSQNCVAYVDYGGSRDDYPVIDDGIAVRPALWVDPESIPDSSSEKNDSAARTEEPSQNEKTVAKNDVITFGRYEQDNNFDNGPEDIEWIVLDVQDGKALLLSRYGLDARVFDGKNTNVWADCSLRAWLNNEFIHTAFNLQERMEILKTETDDGVQDDVFLLSYEDTDCYFSSDEGRMCAPTDYAIERGAYYSDKDQIGGRSSGFWWLRSPGESQSYALFVDYIGSRDGWPLIDDAGFVVRPAFWINLESAIF